MRRLITFAEITESTGMARSTITRRVKALNITISKYKTVRSGQPANALTQDQLKEILEFTPDLARARHIYKTPEQKSKKVRDNGHIKSGATGNAINRKHSLYMTIQPYQMINSFQGAR